MIPVDKEARRERILSLRDRNGCWNVLREGGKGYPELNYYVPNYKSTLWTLVLLADLEIGEGEALFHGPLAAAANQFYDEKAGIYSIGKSHFPIPCLNGNMLYLHSFFGFGKPETIEGIVAFFDRYQRFDDGDFRTPSSYPYFSNRSCYGKHTCYWGVVKLLKGLSFVPKEKRSAKAERLLGNCVEFVLLHEVCFGSRDGSAFINKGIRNLTFPCLYHADFLEILWLLAREGVRDARIEKALAFLLSKRGPDGMWKLEKPVKDLIVPIGRSNGGNELVTKRAREVAAYYRKG